jgi:methionyl-tRNA synthetase
MAGRFYISTPIYYVNERPHIGHLYTTTVADVVARSRRLEGRDVFFLTGTDEHAAKVVDAARERSLSTREWADRNAAAFRETFAEFGIENDDFIRTSEMRHIHFVERAISALERTGDVYLGKYEGWYDASQEEYVPESRAADHDFCSPVTGKPLVRRSEDNYFFRLSAYADALLRHLEAHPDFVQPGARRNEVVARIEAGLEDVPISRTGGGDLARHAAGAPEDADPFLARASGDGVLAQLLDQRRSEDEQVAREFRGSGTTAALSGPLWSRRPALFPGEPGSPRHQ